VGGRKESRETSPPQPPLVRERGGGKVKTLKEATDPQKGKRQKASRGGRGLNHRKVQWPGESADLSRGVPTREEKQGKKAYRMFFQLEGTTEKGRKHLDKKGNLIFSREEGRSQEGEVRGEERALEERCVSSR